MHPTISDLLARTRIAAGLTVARWRRPAGPVRHGTRGDLDDS